MVLPSCNHVMCINCYNDWNKRLQSCPFCRGSLKRVRSNDLWALTGSSGVVDPETVEKENVRHLHCYVDSLPLNISDTLFLVYYDYMLGGLPVSDLPVWLGHSFSLHSEMLLYHEIEKTTSEELYIYFLFEESDRRIKGISSSLYICLCFSTGISS